MTDHELAEIAMAADPNVPIDVDAVPFGCDPDVAGPLPSWYMPVARSSGRSRTRVFVAASFIGALLIVNAAGLCVTNGFAEIAW